jgi:hypothetical protein
MEGPNRYTSADWRWLLALLVIILPLRAWLLCNTEVPARDAVGYIRYALRFDEHSWPEVVRSFDQHPGYPAAIWLVSLPVRALAGATTPELMVFSAQLVSALAAVLLIVPAFYLGKAVWNAPVGFGGTLLFQCLPVSGQHLSDAITESLFMLLVASALMFGAWAVRDFARRHFSLCGVCAGLAYLTRPEGALPALAAGLVLLGLQFTAWRRPWRLWTQAALCLAMSAALVASFYIAVTGRLTVKPAMGKMLETFAETAPPASSGPPVLMANLFAAAYRPADSSAERLVLSVRALTTELTYGMNYFGLALALAPLLIYRQALFARPAALVASSYCAGHMAILVVLAMSVHYVSDRHITPLALMISYPAALGVYEIVAGLLWVVGLAGRERSPSRSINPPGARERRGGRSLQVGVVALVLVVFAACLPRTLQRLHANRAGNHAAGMWIAQRLQPGDMVDDDHAWSHYYAGQVFVEGKDLPAAADYHPVCYVVMTRSRDADVAAKRIAKEQKLQRRGGIVYHWPTDRAADQARVVVYAVPRDPRRHPWKVAAR